MKKTDAEKTLHALNVLIGFFLFLGSIVGVITIGISIVLFFIGIIVNLVLAFVYGNYKKNGRCRKAVITLRAISISIIMLAMLAPMIMMKFQNNKFIYPVKRFCYNYGNYSIVKNNILPSGLPEKCDDYLFITMGSFPAQDYHPSAYLVFHTDSGTISEYENYFESLENSERKVTHMPDKEDYYDDDSRLKCPKELPQHVFNRLKPQHIHDFKNSIIYTVPSYYGKGCMLDYKSGLAVFWY